MEGARIGDQGYAALRKGQLGICGTTCPCPRVFSHLKNELPFLVEYLKAVLDRPKRESIPACGSR
jgi:hypothetical protein